MQGRNNGKLVVSPKDLSGKERTFIEAALLCGTARKAEYIANLAIYAQTPDKVRESIAKAMGRGDYSTICFLCSLIKGTFNNRTICENGRTGVLQILGYLGRLGIPAAQSTIKMMAPTMLNQIAREQPSDDYKIVALGILGSMLSGTIGAEADNKRTLMASVLSTLAVNPRLSDRVREEALKVLLIDVLTKNDEHELRTLVALSSAALCIMRSGHRPGTLKRFALMVITRLAADPRIEMLPSEEDEIVDKLNEFLHGRYPGRLGEDAFWAAAMLGRKNEKARQLTKEIILAYEHMIMAPHLIDKIKQDTALGLFNLGEGNAALNAITALKYIGYQNMGMIRRPVEKLIPLIRASLQKTALHGAMRRELIAVLSIAAKRNCRWAHRMIVEQLADLDRIVSDADSNDDVRRGAIAVIESGLTLPIRGPRVKLKLGECREIALSELSEKMGCSGEPAFENRSIRIGLNENSMLVIKFLRRGLALETLLREAHWIRYLTRLSNGGHFEKVRFDVPKLVRLGKSDLIKIKDFACEKSFAQLLDPRRVAICFIAAKEYFSYPNGTKLGESNDPGEFQEVLSRAAYLLGLLASQGIVHTDVIPLFHSREAGRQDRSYLWWLKGNIVRWLASCDYPNIGRTGLRDFEHLVSWGVDTPPYGYDDRSGIFHMIGNHLLSLLLIAGSFFRNKEKHRRGFTRTGDFVDARDLFDMAILTDIIRGMVCEYYHGFVGELCAPTLPLDISSLAQSMVNEMGVDRHMEEVISARAQNSMPENTFRDLLRQSGYSLRAMKRVRKGESGVFVIDGPHLSSASSFSIFPGLLTAVKSTAALCVVRRALKEAKRRASAPIISPSI